MKAETSSEEMTPKTMAMAMKEVCVSLMKESDDDEPSFHQMEEFQLRERNHSYHLQNLCKQCITTTVRNDTYYPLHYCNHCSLH